MTLQELGLSGKAGLAWLADAAARKEIHTVRAGWSDRLGNWRGKRLPVEDFLADPGRRIGFCDGMIVVDVQARIIQETSFSNFSTGYPDMYWLPDLDTLARVTWADGEAFVLGELQTHRGEPVALSPRVVLDRVVERLSAMGVTVRARLDIRGRLMGADQTPLAIDATGLAGGEQPRGVLGDAADSLRGAGLPIDGLRWAADGRFSIALASLTPRAAGEAAFLTKAALKEVAQTRGFAATFMTITRANQQASLLGIELEELPQCEAPPEVLRSRLADVRALLQPSINAFKAGPLNASGTAVSASSEADALTAIAVSLSAFSTEDETVDDQVTHDLSAAADRLAKATWVAEWLGEAFIANTVELLHHETRLHGAAVTDWEMDRYWRQG